jgi:putative membrane protein
MTRFLIASVSVLVLSAAPAIGQGGNPAVMTPGTPEAAPGVPAAHHPNSADKVFVWAATTAGLAEVALGKLAQQRGHSDAVKKFGARMVEDHTAAANRLDALAKEAGIAQPDKPDPEQQATRDALAKLRGAAFDRAYIERQVGDHQNAVQLFEHEIGSGQDSALKTFASETLPTLFHHLQEAQEVHAMITGQSPQLSGAPTGSQPPRK